MPKQPRRKPSTPAEKQFQRPAPGEQSGSAGRDPGPPSNNPGVDGKPGSGANTGQGNYGQSGYGQGGYRKGGDATPTYQKGVPGRDDPRSNRSNRGSGRPDVAKEETGEDAAWKNGNTG